MMNRPYNASGFISALPPQEGIPGWQRFTMMKYFEDSTGNFDESALWAYEGIIIPGGQMILGRWWSPDEGGIDSSDVSSSLSGSAYNVTSHNHKY